MTIFTIIYNKFEFIGTGCAFTVGDCNNVCSHGYASNCKEGLLKIAARIKKGVRNEKSLDCVSLGVVLNGNG